MRLLLPKAKVEENGGRISGPWNSVINGKQGCTKLLLWSINKIKLAFLKIRCTGFSNERKLLPASKLCIAGFSRSTRCPRGSLQKESLLNERRLGCLTK